MFEPILKNENKVKNSLFLGIRLSALIEIACFFLFTTIIAFFFGWDYNYFNASPHPFWIIVILVSAQYGTVEGLLTAIIASGILLLGHLPERTILLEQFQYLFLIAKTPLLWLVSSVIIGELRMKHIRERDKLRDLAFKAGEKEKRIAEAYNELKKIKERLEIHVAVNSQTTLSVVNAFRHLEDAGRDEIVQGSSELIQAFVSPDKFSIFLIEELNLNLITSYGWEEADHYQKTFRPDNPLYLEIIENKSVVSLRDPNAEVLGKEGVLAVPILNHGDKKAIGMIKVEQIPFVRLRTTEIETLHIIGEWIGSAFFKSNHQHHPAFESTPRIESEEPLKMANQSFSLNQDPISMQGLLNIIRNDFNRILDVESKTKRMRIVDCLMSGVAIFGLKFPALLQFNEFSKNDTLNHNLKLLYAVDDIPTDSYTREIIGKINPCDIKQAFRSVFEALRKGGVIEDLRFIDDRYLMPVDISGVFFSDKSHCKHCFEKVSKDSKVVYYHQVLAAVLAHPDSDEIFPLILEPILRIDGMTKNDSERNACLKLLKNFQVTYPQTKVIITINDFILNDVFFHELEQMDLLYIASIKAEGNKRVFDTLVDFDLNEVSLESDDQGIYRYHFLNGISLLGLSNVNYFDCFIESTNGEVKHYSYLTNITVTPENIYELSRGGMLNRKIDKEVLKTLKYFGDQSQGDNGHGDNNYIGMSIALLFLSFLIDQIQERYNTSFQEALKRVQTKENLWEKMRSVFMEKKVKNWSELFELID